MEAAVEELVTLLGAVIGEQPAALGAHTRLDADLLLESVELTALSDLVARRHPGVDLAGYVAGLSLDELIGLTVGDLAGYLSQVAA